MKNILRLLWVSLALAIAAVALAQAPQSIDKLQVTTSYTLESGANMDLVSGSTFTFGIAGTTNSLLYLTNSGGNVGALGLGAGLSVSGGNLIAASSTSHNPTATIGLSAVNGTAGTFMTSDSAPALGVNIAPTWTNNHTFQITNSLTSGQGYGLQLEPILNQRNAANFSAFQINEWITQAGTGPQYLIQGQTSNGSGGSTVDVFDVNAVGDVTTGIWEGTAVGSIYGGTGLSSFAEGTTLTASGSNTWTALAPGTLNYIYTSGGAGAVTSWQSLSTMLSTLGTAAQGDIIYNNGSAWVYLVPGTSGYYLETLGASANPQWAAVSSGGPVTTTTHDVASYSNTTGSFEDLGTANLASNALTLTETNNVSTGALAVINNSNGTSAVGWSVLMPSFATGADNVMRNYVGQSIGSNNAAYFGFGYVGSTLATNFAVIGFYGANDVWKVTAGGAVTAESQTVQNGLSVGGTAYSYGASSATGAAALLIPATTYTITTGTAANFQGTYFGIPTFTDATSATMAVGSTLTIAGVPVGAGSLTITNAYALNVLAGTTNLQAATINGAATFSSTLTVSGSGAVNLGSGAVTGTGSVVLNSATGGSQGAGTINATGLYVNGVSVGASIVGSNNTWTGTNTFNNTVSGTGITSLFASPPAIGGTAAAAGSFTTLSATGAVNLGSGAITSTGSVVLNSATGGSQGAGTINATGLYVNGVSVGASIVGSNNTWTGTNTFNNTVSGTGITSLFASPPAIGGTLAAAGSFAALSSTGTTALGGAAGGISTPGMISIGNSTTVAGYALELHGSTPIVANGGSAIQVNTQLTAGAANTYNFENFTPTFNTSTYTGNTLNSINVGTPTVNTTGGGTVTGGYQINVAAPASGQAGALNIASGAVNLGSGLSTLGSLSVTGTSTLTGLVGIGGSPNNNVALYTKTAVTTSGGLGMQQIIAGTLTASANSDVLMGLSVENGGYGAVLARGAYTGLASVGIDIGSAALTGTGTIAVSKMLLIEGAPAATQTWGIYQSGLDANYLGGSMSVAGGLTLSKTIASGTGAQTQNTSTGEVQFAGAATSLVVTNSLCSSTSIITATICTNDATAVLGSVVKAAGSFTINMKTAPTGTTLVDYRLTN